MKAGLIAGAPIALGYFPIAVGFGVLADQAGLGAKWATLMSAVVYAGASQFMAVNLILGGAGAAAIVVATLVLNLRHFIMSASLSQRLAARRRLLPVIGFGVTDETFVVNSLTETGHLLSSRFVLSVHTVAYLGWVSGTWVGAHFADLIPAGVAEGLEMGLYAMFIGLLVPAVKKEWRFGIIAAAGAVFSWFFAQHLAAGWAVVLATMFGAALGLPVVGRGAR